MASKFPVLPFLWIFTMGSFSAVASAQETRPARPNHTAISAPADPGTPPGAEAATPWQPKTNAISTQAANPQNLLAAAVKAIDARSSVSAEILQEVALFDKRLVGSGQYWEQRRGPVRLIRLELRIQLGDQTSSLVQVCDGKFLWTSRKLHGDAKLTRIDVARASRGLKQAAEGPQKDKMGALPGLGGLPKLLRGLHAAFDFTVAEPGRWGQEKRAVWRLRGQWKPPWLIEMLPDQQEAIESGKPPDLSKLPSHLPDHVVLLLGQDDLFPYRIEYRRTTARKAARSDAPESRALVTMQLFNVILNAPITLDHFDYDPGDHQYDDRTDEFLESLGETE